MNSAGIFVQLPLAEKQEPNHAQLWTLLFQELYVISYEFDYFIPRNTSDIYI
mgnify:FL=1